MGDASDTGVTTEASMRFFSPLLLLFLAAATARSASPEILVTALHDMQWQVRYDFDTPVASFRFARTPDDSRRREWLPDIGFEIVADGGDLARRKDGKTFKSVRFRMSPKYAALPNDYAPFSPFSDGSTLFHTGRFFACTDVCTGNETWPITLWAATDDHIVLNGKVLPSESSWTDRGDGRMVYVGRQTPRRIQGFLAIIDSGLPEQIRSHLRTQLPSIMRASAQKLGTLSATPTLFVSYDAQHPQGSGKQGSTLPGQVFIHFYGDQWADAARSKELADQLDDLDLQPPHPLR